MLEKVDFFADNKLLINSQKQTAARLPQYVPIEQREQRRFQLRMARCHYNYMHSYIDGVPVSADLPKGEEYDEAYRVRVVQIAQELAENFKLVLLDLAGRQMSDNFIDRKLIEQTKQAYEDLRNDFNIFSFKKEVSNLERFTNSLSELFQSFEKLGNFPKDFAKMMSGASKLLAGFNEEGTTAFLRNAMHELLSTEHGRNYRHARHIDDYENQFISLRKPLLLSMPRQPWMLGDDKPCMQDWFFGYLQTAGFNTSNLRGVYVDAPRGKYAVALAQLQQKFPVSDRILQSVVGNPQLTLEQAARENRLYVLDYAKHHQVKVDQVFGEQRYLGAPIALFYWNSNPPADYPPLQAGHSGVLQPIAIQINQQHHPEDNPIFTPNDCAHANDGNGLKWKLAKFFVNVAGAVDHESVAHLGDCHVLLESIAVASNRQLAHDHPIFRLLKPHFRFMININYDARHSLIVPGGVVATNVGPALDETYRLMAEARLAWRWDEQCPERVFTEKGTDQLPEFPFRDDTLLLWHAIKRFVRNYLGVYYRNADDLLQDEELQAWVNELVSPKYAALQGLAGLKAGNQPGRPYLIDDIDYLVMIVSQIMYMAGPQHASVGFAQYPMMSYMPCVAGTIYQPPPVRSTVLHDESELIKWYPPLDVALYTFSFEYLLSEIQVDRLGHYRSNPRESYFQDERVEQFEYAFQDELALAEIEIRKRNRCRPLPYELQLPSQVPNSVCI